MKERRRMKENDWKEYCDLKQREATHPNLTPAKDPSDETIKQLEKAEILLTLSKENELKKEESLPWVGFTSPTCKRVFERPTTLVLHQGGEHALICNGHRHTLYFLDTDAKDQGPCNCEGGG